MIDSRRKLLTEALGECWHVAILQHACTCGRADLIDALIHSVNMNRTFASADDYEALREKVIVPNLEKFDEYLWDTWANNFDNIPDDHTGSMWWLTLTPEKRNEIICDFGIECLGWEVKKPDLEERVDEWVKSQQKPEGLPNTQIASGKRMPWEEKK